MSRSAAVLCLVSCASGPEVVGEAPDPPPFPSNEAGDPHVGPGNVLLFLADDVGVDRIGAWEVGESPPSTPIIDGLVAEGVRYTRVWAQSLCSPGRAAIQTGRQPYQTGIGHALAVSNANPLAPEEITLAEHVAQGTDGRYATAYAGKWHLSSKRLDDGYYPHPNDQGWGSFAGLMLGLDDEIAFDGLPQSYWSWERTVDGVPARSETYITTANADDAIAAIRALPEPWIVEVAFLAAHAPLHWPPPALWTGVKRGTTEDRQQTNAMIEAMDTEMGRVLAALDDDQRARTTVIFTSDNGSEPAAVSAPYDAEHAKGTPYEGGLRVPLVVAGYGVTRAGTCDHLVQTTDLFATIADLAGAPVDPTADVDSLSLVPTLSAPSGPPVRTHAFAEEFQPSGPPPYTEHFVALRDDRYKLILWRRDEETEDGPAMDRTMFFEVGHGAVDGPDLLERGLDAGQQQAFDALLARLPTTVD